MKKTYRIPVTHTAEIVIEHLVQATSKQEAMFNLGQRLQAAPDPFQCVADGFEESAAVEFAVNITPGSPTIIDGDADEETPDSSDV